MALTDNQREHFLDTVDVWLPPGASGLTKVPLTKQRKDLKLQALPTLTDQVCKYQSAKEDNQFMGPLGSAEKDKIDTLDVFYFLPGTDVRNHSVIQLKTVGHPSSGQFFEARGKGSERPGRPGGSGYLQVFAKRISKPKEIP